MANETIEVLRIPGTLFPRGPFDENAAYKFLNFVESGGNGYVCLQPCTGIPVTNTAYWFKFVFRGEKGDAFTYADLTAEQKAELVRDATAAAQAAASSAQSAADDAAAALQKFNTIKAAIDAIDPTSTEGSIQALAAKQGVLEAELNALGPKVSQNESNIANLQQEIDEITPIVIEGDVINAPDEEDLTMVNNVIKFNGRSTAVNQKGYKILRKGASLATQMTATNTIYEVRYAFDLDGSTLTIPSGCALKFDGGSIANGEIVLDETELLGKVSLDVDCSGTCINSSIWHGWFASVDKFIVFINDVEGPHEYNFLPGHYNVDEYIDKFVNSYIRIKGNGCVLNFSSKSAVAAIYLHPKNYEIIGTSTITTAVVHGDKTIQVANASVFNVGDAISIRDTRESSFSFHRDYQQGEFASIIDIDLQTNTLTIDHPIYGNYAITNSFVYSYVGINIELSNISLTSDNGTLGEPSFGIYCVRALSAVCESVNTEGFKNGLGIYFSTNVLIRNCSVNCPAVGYSGDGYGLQIGNTQGCRVSGGKYVGRNHGISIGGSYTGEFAIVNRNIEIIGTESVSTRSGEAWGSLDCHGNSEYITFSDNVCTGVNFGGRNISVLRNTCIGVNGIYGTELISLNNKIEGNKTSRIVIRMSMESGATTTNWTPETKTELLDVLDNTIEYFGTGLPTGIAFSANMSTVYSNASNCIIRYKGNTIKGQNATLVYFGFGSTTTDVDSSKFGKVLFENNIIDMPTEYKREIIADEIILRNNRVVAMNNPFLTYCNYLHIEGNTIDATRSFADQSSNATRVVVLNNTVNSGRCFSGSKLFSKLLVSGNILSITGGAQVTNITYSGSGDARAIVTGNSVWDSSDLTIGNVSILAHGMNASFYNGAKVIPSATATSIVEL